MPLTIARALLACTLVCAFSPLVHSAGIDSPADWNTKFASYYGGSFVPIKTPNQTPDSDGYAWGGYYWIEAYVSLAQTTGSSTYMDKAKQIIDHMVSMRDDVRFASTPLTPEYWSGPSYYLYHDGTPAPGWRRLEGGKYEINPLIDGRICEIILRWCELARRGFPQYESAIAGYLPFVKQTLDLHLPALKDIPNTTPIPTDAAYNHTLPAKAFKYWRSEKDGPLASDQPITWSGYMAVNHVCTYARALMAYNHLSGTTTYRDEVQSMLNYFINSLDTSRPTIAVWKYSPLNDARWDDVDHATVSLALVEEAYRVGGYGIDGTHVARLVQTFHTFYRDADKDVTFRIDGTGSAQGGQAATAATGVKSWLWLSQFDPTILAKVRATYEKFYQNTNWPQVMAGWANLVYWESLVNTGTAAFDDESFGPPGPQAPEGRPLFTDAVNRLKSPYASNITWSDSTAGAHEGATHRVVDYTITAWQWAFFQASFSPAENGALWGGIQIAYKTTGNAAFSLTLSDGTNTMSASLPAQAAYGTRTINWADFSNHTAVNKTALTRFRIIANGIQSGTGQISFDDVRLTGSPAVRPLFTDDVNRLKYPYSSNISWMDSINGAFEGATHRVVDYTIGGWQWAFFQAGFSPAENAADWAGITIAYQHTGPAALSLTLGDGVNTMSAALPAQAAYGTRTLYWSDFGNQAAVNKTALTRFRIIANGIQSGTGQIAFDDVNLVQ
ncbi:MAG: hypothetical protein ABII82_01690 [Verrucomicrobiota bacterium]